MYRSAFTAESREPGAESGILVSKAVDVTIDEVKLKPAGQSLANGQTLRCISRCPKTRSRCSLKLRLFPFCALFYSGGSEAQCYILDEQFHECNTESECK